MVPRVHELSLASSAILADPSLCARYCAAQIGASATTTASCAAVAASLRAVPPVTQPPQLKPTIMQATAPTTRPTPWAWYSLEIAWQILSWPERGRQVGARTIA